MTDMNAAWIAAVIDCEGCLSITSETDKRTGRINYRIRAVVCSTNEDILFRCKSMYGGCISKWKKSSATKGKPYRMWLATGNSLWNVINDAYPYLIIKLEQARIAILFQSTLQIVKPGVRVGKPLGWISDLRMDMKLAIQALNHRGTDPIPEHRLAALDRIRDYLETTDPSKPMTPYTVTRDG